MINIKGIIEALHEIAKALNRIADALQLQGPIVHKTDGPRTKP